MRRSVILPPLMTLVVAVLGAAPAVACGGLVAPNGTVRLVRTRPATGGPHLPRPAPPTSVQ